MIEEEESTLFFQNYLVYVQFFILSHSISGNKYQNYGIKQDLYSISIVNEFI